MRTAYICSPYSGDTKRNKKYARELTALAIQNGCAPITPHLYITECLDDGVQEQRNKGLSVAIRLLEKCDVVYIGTKYGISSGMQLEIEWAEMNGIEVKKL